MQADEGKSKIKIFVCMGLKIYMVIYLPEICLSIFFETNLFKKIVNNQSKTPDVLL